ncbi:SdiA-regulated domain-containing protein [Spirosoma knui]
MRCLLLILSMLLAGCGTSSKKNEQPDTGTLDPPFRFPYQLTKPAETYTMPNTLREISGLTYYKNDKLLCVQDEEAVVYVFDINKKKVVKDFGFGGYGDFEGIEYVGDQVYVLESNGNLFRFEPESTQIGRTKTDLPKKTEVEGLGYDPKTKRLLIAVKQGGGASSDKAVYSYDLLNRAVFKDMQLSEEQLQAAGIDAKTYKPSGIAVHPITGEWYIVSAAGKRLLITSRRAKIIYTVALDPTLFRQPEGICFAPNGDLYIASEGDGKKGYILKFGYKQ